MAVSVNGRHYAHPVDQGRLGKDVEERLRVVADMVERLQQCGPEDREQQALAVADCAIRQLSDLAHRREEVDQLCTAVAEELMMAESVIADLNSIARMGTRTEEALTVPGAEEGWVALLPRMPHVDYASVMSLLAKSIRRQFSGDTAERWKKMAELAIKREAALSRMLP